MLPVSRRFLHDFHSTQYEVRRSGSDVQYAEEHSLSLPMILVFTF